MEAVGKQGQSELDAILSWLPGYANSRDNLQSRSMMELPEQLRGFLIEAVLSAPGAIGARPRPAPTQITGGGSRFDPDTAPMSSRDIVGSQGQHIRTHDTIAPIADEEVRRLLQMYGGWGR